MMAFDSRIYFTIDLIISSFNQHHKPGQTFSKFLYFGYADRCVQWWPNRRTKPSLAALQSEKFLNHSLRCQRTIKTKLLNLWSRHSFLIASSIISNSDDLKRPSKNQCTQQCIAKIRAEGRNVDFKSLVCFSWERKSFR